MNDDREASPGGDAGPEADAGPGPGDETWGRPLAGIGELIGDALEGVLRGFPGTPLGGGLRLDVFRGPEGYLVLVDLPGVARDDVEVSVAGEELLIAGRRRRPSLEPGSEPVRVERGVGRFRRAVRLWPDADPARVRARLEDGVLRVTIERRGDDEPRRVEVET